MDFDTNMCLFLLHIYLEMIPALEFIWAEASIAKIGFFCLVFS